MDNKKALIRFYVKLPADGVGNAAKIKIGNDDAITVHGTSAVGIKGPDGNELTEEDHVLIYSIPVSAKRMTDTITIPIKNPDWIELLTEKNTYSASEYCTAQVKDYKDAKAAGTDTTDLPVIDADVYALLAADMADWSSLTQRGEVNEILWNADGVDPDAEQRRCFNRELRKNRWAPNQMGYWLTQGSQPLPACPLPPRTDRRDF